MLNLKQLRFQLFTAEPQKAVLKVKGEKEVKGSNFAMPSQAELVNKNCHIATLTSKSAELEIEIKIEKGVGYSFRETRQKEKLEIGAISVDAIFTPVKKVNYKIENMRVGERTDYDRLFLEIETDGIITPEEAFWQASEILVKHFSLLVDAFKSPVDVSLEGKAPKKKKKSTTELPQEAKVKKRTKFSSTQVKTKYAKKKKRKKTK